MRPTYNQLFWPVYWTMAASLFGAVAMNSRLLFWLGTALLFAAFGVAACQIWAILRRPR